MSRSTKTKLAAVVAAILVLAVGLGAAGAIAASDLLSPSKERQAIIEDAADRLGVEPSELSDALREALTNRVDEAVEDGRLTEEQGDRLKERIESGEFPLPFGVFGGPQLDHFGPFGHFGHLGSLGEAASSFLGFTEAELREQLAEGKTLAEIAKAEGKSVDALVQALVAAATEKLDDAVADGRLTREQADELAEGLGERMADLVNRELPERRFRGELDPFDRGFGFDPGLGPPLHRHVPQA